MAEAQQAEPVTYGGQAVIEGVMIRSRDYVSVACRLPRPDGQPGTDTPIDIHTEPVRSLYTKVPKLRKAPLVRGIISLFEMLALGLRALERSANLQAPYLTILVVPLLATVPAPNEEQEGRKGTLNGPLMVGSMALGLTIGVVLFMFLPNWLADLIGEWVGRPDDHFLLNLVEGAVRLTVFVLYISAIGLMPDIRRIFMYHGAEHKTVNGFEAGRRLVPDEIVDMSVIHPRCGTNFAFIVVVMSLIVFCFLPWTESIWPRLGMRLACLPIVAGLSFELIRLVGKHREVAWLQGLIAPGLAMQRLTTREPTLDMIEVALASFEAVHLAEERGELTCEVRGEPSAEEPYE